MGNGGSTCKYTRQGSRGKVELQKVRSTVSQAEGQLVVTSRYHTSRQITEDYEVADEELGHGYNGSVYSAISKANHDKYAVKPFKLHGISSSTLKELRNEVYIFLTMDHPHVARLCDVYENDKELKLVMERLEGGELLVRIQKQKRFSEVDAADSVAQMLLAVNYLHSKHIVHRDIKLENYLYDAVDSNHLKLIDFGFSRVHKETMKKMQKSCGTVAYMAPEVIEGDYDNKCDIWSIGVVTFILLMGYMPFSGKTDEARIDNILNANVTIRDEPWSRLSWNAKDFIRKLIDANAHDRLSAEQALNHPWITERENNRAASSTVDPEVVESLCQFANSSNFRRACMSMLAWSLSNADRAKVRAAFLEIDTDKTGVIQLVELKNVLASKVDIADDQAQAIFLALDANCNEEVHYSDFLAAMMSSKIVMHDDLIVSAFKRFDLDGSGFITVDELRQVLGDVYSDPKELDSMIAEADVGVVDGKISQDEFIGYLKGDEAKEVHLDAAGKLIDFELQKREAPKQTSTPGVTPTAASSTGVTTGITDKSLASTPSGIASDETTKGPGSGKSSICAIL